MSVRDSDKKDYPYKYIHQISPVASSYYDNGNDGKDGRWRIRYSCPKCGSTIDEYQQACEHCGSFFDWSKIAHIKMKPTIEWR